MVLWILNLISTLIPKWRATLALVLECYGVIVVKKLQCYRLLVCNILEPSDGVGATLLTRVTTSLPPTLYGNLSLEK
jgi:hypothetical protein